MSDGSETRPRGGGGALRLIADDEARRPGERLLAATLIEFVLRRQSMHAKPVAVVDGAPISFAQMKILFHVPESGSIALGRLAQAAGVSAASMTQAIVPIEQAGLVQRERNEQDRRVVEVRVTERGLRELNRFRTAFAADAAFARAMACELAHAYRGVVKELKNQKLRSSLERLANWLIARNAETGGHNRFELPFEKKILASRLGMAPEVLSRTFSALVPYKVRVQGATIELGDLPELTKLAKPTPTIDDPLT